MDIKKTYFVDTILTSHQVCQLLTNGKVNKLPLSSGKTLGVAQDNTGTVILKGVSKGHSNLIVGANYYYNADGIISTDITGTFLGVAISNSELYIPEYIID